MQSSRWKIKFNGFGWRTALSTDTVPPAGLEIAYFPLIIFRRQATTFIFAGWYSRCKFRMGRSVPKKTRERFKVIGICFGSGRLRQNKKCAWMRFRSYIFSGDVLFNFTIQRVIRHNYNAFQRFSTARANVYDYSNIREACTILLLYCKRKLW